MKRILFALIIATWILPVIPKAEAQSDVSIDFFYDNISGGNWIDVAGYGYCWQPDVAVNDVDWRPYTDGYWVYTDAGWTWVSYEDFGWATYHFGRWLRLTDLGWVWVPGYEWGPAWVSWRTGGDYVGWAPLPPTGEVVYEGQPITSRVDVEFDIGPAYYNFIELRYIGEPVLRSRLLPPAQNVTIITNTVNVTNITYQNSIVFNRGPDFSRVNQFSLRPIPQLKLERETNVAQVRSKRGTELTRVQGDKLMITAPVKIQRSPRNIAPPVVKTKVAQAKIEHGWSGVSDPKVKTDLERKMRTENVKAIPPATFQPNQRRPQTEAATGQPPQTGPRNAPAAASPFPAGRPALEDRNQPRGREGRKEMPAATPTIERPTQSPVQPGMGRYEQPRAPRAVRPPAQFNTPAPPERTPQVERERTPTRPTPPPGTEGPNQGRNVRRPAPDTPSAESYQGQRQQPPPERVRGNPPRNKGEGKKEEAQGKKRPEPTPEQPSP